MAWNTAELIALAKANPSKMTLAWYGDATDGWSYARPGKCR